jgi:hypothetical protein
VSAVNIALAKKKVAVYVDGTKRGFKGAIGEIQPSYIALGHEMSHAEALLKGTFIDTSIQQQYTFVNYDGRKETLVARLEELVAVGIYSHMGRVSENDLRIEHGLPRRVRY